MSTCKNFPILNCFKWPWFLFKCRFWAVCPFDYWNMINCLNFSHWTIFLAQSKYYVDLQINENLLRIFKNCNIQYRYVIWLKIILLQKWLIVKHNNILRKKIENILIQDLLYYYSINLTLLWLLLFRWAMLPMDFWFIRDFGYISYINNIILLI